jgi:predicted metal-dependent peptidase
LACSRPRSAPSSPVSSHGSSMFCTLINEVQKVETYLPGQPVKLAPIGGGGTDFRRCFRWLEERGITPQTLVFLTDLWGTFPSDARPYPVLWASTGKCEVPFGQVIPSALTWLTPGRSAWCRDRS